MEKENNEINVLDELNKGACMGQDAIHFILEKKMYLAENEIFYLFQIFIS